MNPESEPIEVSDDPIYTPEQQQAIDELLAEDLIIGTE
jgi:hypothetical protein